MVINTRLGRMELTKREQSTLTDAMCLMRLIAKHGDDDVDEDASTASDKIAVVLERLMAPVEEPSDAKEAFQTPGRNRRPPAQAGRGPHGQRLG